MLSKEKSRCRKVKAILRYYQPNPNKAFFYHLLFSFYPLHNEEELKSLPVTGCYQTELLKPGVINIINRNKAS